MLSYNDLKSGVIMVYEGEPYQVLKASFLRKQQRKPVMQTEIKSLVSGKVLERNFHMNETFEEADIEKEDLKYLYNHRDEYFFADSKDPSKRFPLSKETIGEQINFVKENTEVRAVKFNDEIITIEVPIKADLVVEEAPPGERGNTAGGGSKVIELETGAKINAPLHVNTGDIVRVNTQTGEYDSRIEKSKESF